MEITLRREGERDHRIVEELTREAFWNVYAPGCGEHLLARNLRKAKEVVPELDFVAIRDNEIIGNIMYAKTSIVDSRGEYGVLTFGPISVLPKYQHKGVGKMLIEHTGSLAKEMGFRAILIYGDPEYYQRFGFKLSKEFSITNDDGKYPAALMALELFPHALQGIQGKFDEGKAYGINEKELEEYEKGFAQKEKRKTPTQERFNELSGKFI
jgi:predicted N-acetyltransferase YhbS